MSMTIKGILMAHAGMESVEVPVMDATESYMLENEVEHHRMQNEISENSREIGQIAEVVEEVASDVEELEDVVDGMECLLDMPQLNRGAVNYLYQRANRLQVKLGGEVKAAVAGQESLETDEAYRAAIRDAISGNEGFMENVKKAGNAIASLIKQLYYGLIDGFKSIFNIVTNNTERAKKLKERLKTATFKEEISLGGWNRFFNGVPRVTQMDDLFYNLGRTIPQFSTFIREFKDVTKITRDDLEKMLKGVDTISKNMASAVKGNASPVTIIMNPFGKDKKVSGAGWTLFVWSVPEVGDTPVEKLPELFQKFSFTESVPGRQVDNAAKLSGKVPGILNAGSATQVLMSIDKDQVLVDGVRKILDSEKGAVDTIVANLKKSDDASSPDTKLAIRTLKVAMSKYVQLVNSYCRIVSMISRAKIQCVEAHIA